MFVLLDPSFPGAYAAYADLAFIPIRLSGFLNLMDSGDSVHTIQGNQVADTLLANPGAVMVIVGTPAPDTVLSQNSSLLSDWVHAGGLLVWAGGPLGFSSGHPGPGGSFSYESLHWAGQTQLVGFNLTDPAPILPRGSASPYPPPPLMGLNSTPMQSALGMLYLGTADGANVSQVTAHGGVILGTTARTPGEPGVSPRASIAYIPVAQGGVLFFGGADLSSYQAYLPYASGWISEGTIDVAEDIAVFLGLGYSPIIGPVASGDVDVPPGATISETLDLRGYVGTVVLLVRSTVDGSVLSLWGTSTTTAGLPPLGLAGGGPPGGGG
ncbi:MAG TPA: hypothetical protein VFG07_08755 [Thermoplasmata archaeon]|nr:hypothetical protein [Thermoplasmata archaeon]